LKCQQIKCEPFQFQPGPSRQPPGSNHCQVCKSFVEVGPKIEVGPFDCHKFPPKFQRNSHEYFRELNFEPIDPDQF
jgi:hypothetical protein